MSSSEYPVAMHVDCAAPLGAWRPIWNWFGHDEPNYTTMPHGRKLLGELAALHSGPVHVRVHNLLTSGDGTAALKKYAFKSWFTYVGREVREPLDVVAMAPVGSGRALILAAGRMF